MKQSYISHPALASALGWSENDLRIVRRCTDCPVAPRRRGRNCFELEAVLAWLTKILPRMAPDTELAIRTNAAAIEEL